MKKQFKILIIHPGGIGDLIMFTPALRVLRDSFLDSKIDIFAGYTLAAAEVLPNWKGVEVYDFDFPKSNFFGRLRFIYRLRKERYDLAIVASGVDALKGSLFAFLIGAKKRVGDYRKYKWFYTHSVKLNGNQHKTLANLDLLKSLGLNVNFKDALFFEIRNEDRQFAEKFIFKNDLKKKVLVGFAPCVGLKQQFKRWPKDNFVELGRKILDSYTDSFILIFGSFSEKEFCSKIKSDLGKNTMEITDFSLKQVAALIDKCKVFVASDCGLGHIATTTNTNLISIFGPTISERTGPYIHVAKVQIISEKCNYQYHDIYRAKNYDATRQHQCLIKITPDKVFSKVKEILVK